MNSAADAAGAKGAPGASGWPWPDSLDALVAAPAYHKLLFENERVRLLEVRIPPGAFVPVHTHRWPSAIYVAAQSDFIRRDGDGNVIFDSRTVGPPPDKPFVQWTGPLPPHSVENVGSREILLITTELKEPPASSKLASKRQQGEPTREFRLSVQEVQLLQGIASDDPQLLEIVNSAAGKPRPGAILTLSRVDAERLRDRLTLRLANGGFKGDYSLNQMGRTIEGLIDRFFWP